MHQRSAVECITTVHLFVAVVMKLNNLYVHGVICSNSTYIEKIAISVIPEITEANAKMKMSIPK